MLGDVWAFSGLSWLAHTSALLSPPAAPAEVGHSCSRSVNDFTRRKPGHSTMRSVDTHRDEMFSLKARRTGLKFLPGRVSSPSPGRCQWEALSHSYQPRKNLALLASLVLIYFNTFRQPWAQEAVNAWPRVFSWLLHWERGMETPYSSSAGTEGQKTFSLPSSPSQTHTVNFFPKHSVDKFYRRLGK